jgi:hypothetical protein
LTPSDEGVADSTSPPVPEASPREDDRREKRRAYEAAATHLRAYRERYYPLRVLGGRPAETVTPEVTTEIERLASVAEAARVAWEATRRA